MLVLVAKHHKAWARASFLSALGSYDSPTRRSFTLFPQEAERSTARIAGRRCRRRKEAASHEDRFNAKALQHPRQVGNNLESCGSSRRLRMRGWGSQSMLYLGTLENRGRI